MPVELPDPALAELRRGRTIEAIWIVREATGLDMKESKAVVDAAIARDPALQAVAGSPMKHALLDWLASSWKFPFAAGMGAGALALWVTGEFFPHMLKQHDPGLLMLAMLGIPLVVVAGALMLWARRWRAMREAQVQAAEASAKAPAPRPRFGGLPEPGGASPATALPAEALAALDRNEPIEAIKILRAQRGLGLAEAKSLVDAELKRRGTGR